MNKINCIMSTELHVSMKIKCSETKSKKKLAPNFELHDHRWECNYHVSLGGYNILKFTITTSAPKSNNNENREIIDSRTAIL